MAQGSVLEPEELTISRLTTKLENKILFSITKETYNYT
jgi:hypothetical protein